MPAILSEAFRLPITGGNIQHGSLAGLDPQAQFRYGGTQAVGSNANVPGSAGPMNYQATPPMRPPAPYQSVGAGQHVPVTGYTQPGVAYNPPGAAQGFNPQVAWQQMTSSFNMGSPEFANTLLFIAVGIFFLFILDMIVKSAVAK